MPGTLHEVLASDRSRTGEAQPPARQLAPPPSQTHTPGSLALTA